MAWIQPIYDRTSADLQRFNKKAFLNYEDLNRIEGDCRVLADYFNVNITTKTWQPLEFIYKADIQRIVDNIKTLKSKYAVYPYTPQPPALPVNTYQKWNNAEKIINDLYVRYNEYLSMVARCGDIYTGEVW